MTTAEVAAPAKINLTLHVTGRRADGYHTLDSLVVFAGGAADRLTFAPADGLSLTVTGPFARGVPADGENLVLRAARALSQARGATRGAAIKLEKNLPHGAGIGGGSADAAAALRALADLWGVEPLTAAEALPLGADLPVCLGAPRPQRMSGIGGILEAMGPLPPLWLVLANPGTVVETRAVFARLAGAPGETAPAMEPLPAAPGADAFLGWLARQRNDLEAPARALCPDIGTVLASLAELPGCRLARMSGSGATCWGAFTDAGAAADAARALAAAHPGWWVTASGIAQS